MKISMGTTAAVARAEDNVSYTALVKQLKGMVANRMDHTLTTAKLPSGALELFGLYHDPDLESAKELLKGIVLLIDKKAKLSNTAQGQRIVFTYGDQLFTITAIKDDVQVPKYGFIKILRYRLMAA